jgi:hypothetical protein
VLYRVSVNSRAEASVEDVIGSSHAFYDIAGKMGMNSISWDIY